MNTTEDLIVEGNVTDDPNLLTDFDLHCIFKKNCTHQNTLKVKLYLHYIHYDIAVSLIT